MLLNRALTMDIKLEKPDQNGASESPKTITQAASTINQIANKLANSKAQQTSASETLTKLSLALSAKSSTVGATSQSQLPAQVAFITSQAPGGAITIVTSQPSLIQNQISLLTSQPKPITTSSSQGIKNVASKLTDSLSLKQSPTLTKQLTTPISGSTNKVQVITAYMCRYCGQQFDSPTAMQLHIQNHLSGKTPHQCSVCGKEYRTPSKLQRHVRVHSGERPYPCTVCGRRFTRSDHVKQHMKVHMQAKDINICRLCSDMKFNRRQTLHLHLQQLHLIQQVFTCHRCGEAYESLEEMQTHKLTHDSVLNKLQDGAQRSLNVPLGIAKFSLSPQRQDGDITKFEPIKTEKEATQQSKAVSLLDKMGPNGMFIPVTLDTLNSVGKKVIFEGLSKNTPDLKIPTKYQEEVQQLKEEASKLNVLPGGVEKRVEIEEQIRIAQCFTIKPDGTNDAGKAMDAETSENDEQSKKQAKTFVSEDGMSMFILPGSLETNGVSKDDDEEDDDVDDEDIEEMELTIATDQNSSKESGIGDENEDSIDKMEDTDSTEVQGQTKLESSEGSKEGKISGKSGFHGDGYTKPCPKSKKPGYLQEANPTNNTDTESEMTSKATSLLSSELSERLKAKVEQNKGNTSSQPLTVIASANSYQHVVPNALSSLPTLPKLTLIRNPSSVSIPNGALQNYFLPVKSKQLVPTSSVSKAAVPGALTQNYVANTAPSSAKQEMPKLIRCDHCCIWFEDNAMSLLHNTLHAADESDPFTCRKCLKKLGNRLEFMAHLIWHLEPNMDI